MIFSSLFYCTFDHIYIIMLIKVLEILNIIIVIIICYYYFYYYYYY